MPLSDDTLLRMLDLFKKNVNELATLAVELDPGNRDVEELRRLVLSALKTNDIGALEMSGARLSPHAARIYDRDASLLKTLRAEAAGSDMLLPLIGQFEAKWPELKSKRREKIFSAIEEILKVYMVVHNDIAPADLGLS